MDSLQTGNKRKILRFAWLPVKIEEGYAWLSPYVAHQQFREYNAWFTYLKTKRIDFRIDLLR